MDGMYVWYPSDRLYCIIGVWCPCPLHRSVSESCNGNDGDCDVEVDVVATEYIMTDFLILPR